VIDTVQGQQVLHCRLGDLAAGAGVSVHVSSATTSQSCGSYANTATLTAGNHPWLSDEASTRVDCTPAAVTHRLLATTGAGPIGPEVGWAIALIVGGALLLTISRQHKRTAAHRQ
jgi:hypothetical protein